MKDEFLQIRLFFYNAYNKCYERHKTFSNISQSRGHRPPK